MSSKRKAPSAVKQNTKRFRSTGSRTRSVNQPKHQDGREAAGAAPTMNQAITNQITQQVVQGPSASSSAQDEVIYNRTSTNIYKEVDDYQRYKERRIILIGKTGTGKSTLGNAILCNKCFKTEGLPMQSVTTHCEVGQTKSKDGKNIVVIDTPGLNDTRLEQRYIFEELSKCTVMTAPGPHVFCLVIRGDDRFTQENIDTLDEFCKFFGEEIYKYVIVVFTHKASMGKSATTNDCLSALPREFVSKLLNVGEKAIAIESKVRQEKLEKQINELLKLIDKIIEINGGGYYSGETFKVAEEAFRKRIPKIQEEVAKQFEEMKKSLEEKHQKIAMQEQKWKKKLQALQNKCVQEKNLKEKEQLEKANCLAQMKTLDAMRKKEITLLEKKCKETEKAKEACERRLQQTNEDERQTGLARIIEDRSNVRTTVQESQSFGRNAVMQVVGTAYDTVSSWLGSAIQSVLSRSMHSRA